MLLAADVIGLTGAFVVAEVLYQRTTSGLLSQLGSVAEYVVFVISLPAWIAAAKLLGLYERDEERTDHSTADDFVRVFLLITVGVFLFTRLSLITGSVDANVAKLTVFWGLAIALVALGRVLARTIARRSAAYTQNAIIVGSGEIGQLVGRKLIQHPEYGIKLVGFVGDEPWTRRPELADVDFLGATEELPEFVREFDIERVIVAFTAASDRELLQTIRLVRRLNVQLDVIPRLYEIMGPNVAVHHIEGLPLFGLPAPRLSRSSRLLKRMVDVVGAFLGLIVTAPLFLYAAWRIKRDSPGPVFFRQTRLGMGMREFTLLKFRTMKVDTEDREHREFITTTMTHHAAPADGLYKLDRGAQVTKIGRWLRKTSLDEVPQLINILRGDMSLVGPRPCIPYETELFADHHFDRFMVPAGLTGLWQVTARANSTFGEALDMDIAYARGWSLGLDLRLLLRTPLQLFRPNATR